MSNEPVIPASGEPSDGVRANRKDGGDAERGATAGHPPRPCIAALVRAGREAPVLTLYTFYCCRDDGISTALTTHELSSDHHALVYAMRLLEEHLSAAYVCVFDVDRRVLTRRRVQEDLRILLSRPRRD